MKKVITRFCTILYKINNQYLRKILRYIIAKCDDGQAFSQSLRIVMKKYHGIDIGIGTYGSCFNTEQVLVGTDNLVIGKFCSIARGVSLFSRNHPYWNTSTSALFYNRYFSKKYNVLEKDMVEYTKLHIGNDVWIGQNAVVLPSCNYIGDGAVIGAGSIVTKDVPDYAIVAGNPAKLIKYRFEPEIIAAVKKTEWWNWDLDFIVTHIHKIQNIEEFLAFANEIAAEEAKHVEE